MIPDSMFRKSIFFTEDRWNALQQLMPLIGAQSPSIAIERLIEREMKRQQQQQGGTVNVRTTTKQDFRD